MKKSLCPVCHTLMKVGFDQWHFFCPNCSYEQSDLLIQINEHHAVEKIDHNKRMSGLKKLRKDNFELILKALLEFIKKGKLLEIGCAHGWFLELASSKFEVLGIEPDNELKSTLRDSKLSVRFGLFPDVLSDQDMFDVIVFNDVFEHIPDSIFVVEKIRKHLRNGGFLVINLPSRNGFFYRAAKIMHQIGINIFFNRMWQKSMPSPHVHYFSPDNLSKLLETNGFKVQQIKTLETLKLKGLWQRITQMRHGHFLLSLFVFTGVLFLLPLLKILPKDIFFVIAQRAD